jgi:Transposase DDE domain
MIRTGAADVWDRIRAGAVWRPPPGKRGAALHAALVSRPCSCIRRLAGTRAREIQFGRFLRNRSVTAGEMACHAGERTTERAARRDVVIIQDTSELVLGGRRAKENGYGKVGKGGVLHGLLLHATLAVDAATGSVIGLLDAKVWNRKAVNVRHRRSRKTSNKESQRWIDATLHAGEVLVQANGITNVSDRESDIYEHFARRPPNVDLIVRTCPNRRVETDEEEQIDLLFERVDSQPEQGRFQVKIPAAPGRKERLAELAVRFARVAVRKPMHGAAHDLPATVTLTMVDVRETSKPAKGEPIHWRLTTTHEVANLSQARRIIDLYRLRWTVEEFFHTLKTAGFNIEAADIGDPRVMIKFVTAAAVAAVTVMQLVKARDGVTGEKLTDAFDPADQPLLEAVSAQLEGQTAKQRNQYPRGSLAFAAWVIARLGGWTGYYGKPGPQVMRRGLDDFKRIKYGASLGLQHV